MKKDSAPLVSFIGLSVLVLCKRACKSVLCLVVLYCVCELEGEDTCSNLHLNVLYTSAVSG